MRARHTLSIGICLNCKIAGFGLGAEPSGSDECLCEQQLSGEVKIPFVNVQLADGTLVVHEEIG